MCNGRHQVSKEFFLMPVIHNILSQDPGTTPLSFLSFHHLSVELVPSDALLHPSQCIYKKLSALGN